MDRLRSPAFWVAFAIALVLGAGIAIVQIDRQARGNAGLASFVPVGVGGFADEQRARLALATDPVSAEPYVKSVVARRPVDVSHLSHLAIWAAEAGEMDLAARTLTEASRRGWRDTFVQVSVLGSAAAEGNLEAATQRLDALARFQADPAILMRALDIMLTLDGAEANIAAQVGQSEYLKDVLVDYARERPQAGSDVASIVGELERQGVSIDCLRRAEIVRSMLQRGNPEARGTWGSECGTATSRELSFTFGEDKENPFRWTFRSEAGLSARPGKEPGSLTISNRKLVEKMGAWRFLALPPGSHTLAVEKTEQGIRTIADRRPADFEIAMACLGEGGGTAAILGRTSEPGSFTFRVPDNCPTQQLRVLLGRGRVENLRLSLG